MGSYLPFGFNFYSSSYSSCDDEEMGVKGEVAHHEQVCMFVCVCVCVCVRVYVNPNFSGNIQSILTNTARDQSSHSKKYQAGISFICKV